MRALEECVLKALEACGVQQEVMRQQDTTGIWIDNHKVAAIGVKCRKWITMHGLAVNIEQCSLDNFEGIVPCGLEGRKVGCVNQFLLASGREPLTVREFSKYMKDALEEVFQIELHTRKHDRIPKSIE
jgi:lipoyl(octanoyl) transferase